MANSFNVVFMGKDYSFPNDLMFYLDSLNTTEQVGLSAVSKFVDHVRYKHDVVEVFNEAFIDDLVREQASSFIRNLSDRGIFSRTIDEYALNTNSYQNMKDIMKTGVSAFGQFLYDQISDYLDGFDAAEQRAISSITGTGLTVFTSSAASLAALSAMEYSAIKRQTKKADQQFKNDLEDIRASGYDAREKKENRYKADVYIPQMSNALLLSAYEMLDKYILDLGDSGQFDMNALDYIDTNKSKQFLDNVDVTDAKDEFFCNAFLACPFNIEIYMKLIEEGLFDKSTLGLVETFSLKEDLAKAVSQRYEELPHSNNLSEEIALRRNYIDALELLGQSSRDEMLRQLGESLYRETVRGYDNLKTMLKSDIEIKQQVLQISPNPLSIDGSQIVNHVNTIVGNIISDENFSTLMTECGYNRLLYLVTPTKKKRFESKEQVDNYYRESITRRLQTELSRAKEERREYEEQKTVFEKQAQDNLAKRQQFSMIALAILCIIPILFQYGSGYKKKADVHSYIMDTVNSNIKNNMTIDDSCLKNNSFTKCEINTIEVYKDDYFSMGDLLLDVDIYCDAPTPDYPALICDDLVSEIFGDNTAIENDKLNKLVSIDYLSRFIDSKIHFNDGNVVEEPGYGFDKYIDGKKINFLLPRKFLIFYAVYLIALTIAYLLFRKKNFGISMDYSEEQSKN